jgi:uncharacterized protein
LKFRLEDIPAEGREDSFTEDETRLNARLGEETAYTGLHFTEPVQVRVHISRSGKMIRVKSRIDAKVKGICARCLEVFSLPLGSQFQLTLKPKPDFPPAEEVELSREDLESDFYEGEEIDLSPLIQDQVLLTIPPKLVCREDCRGLCPRCGRNLNRETCNCPDKAVDPRLEALRHFRVN